MSQMKNRAIIITLLGTALIYLFQVLRKSYLCSARPRAVRNVCKKWENQQYYIEKALKISSSHEDDQNSISGRPHIFSGRH